MRALKQLALVAALAVTACGGGGSSSEGGGGLGGFATERIAIDGVPFEAWIADSEAEQRRGFMSVSEDEIDPLPDGTPRGMLFTFTTDSQLSFWMRDTTVPLDIAYATADGRIVEVHHLVPLDETPVVAEVAVRFAFEALQGTFARFGIGTGDRIVRPQP